jgi:predicted DNA-binding protein (MmcQ/YjbR family)
MAKRDDLKSAEMKLRSYGLRFPEATEDFPWEHRALKVKGKIFVVLNRQPASLTVSLKLPESAHDALRLPFASPTRYGLGKSGWITATFQPGDKIPVDMLIDWITESYRAVAPKRVLAQLDGGSPRIPTRRTAEGTTR